MNLKKIATTLTLAAAMSTAIGTPEAQAENYVSVLGGYSDVEDIDFENGGQKIDSDFDDGFVAGAAFGHYFGNGANGYRWRIEGELSYREADIENQRLNGSRAPASDGETNATAAMANGYIDFRPDAKFVPYLGVGIGVADVEFDGLAANGSRLLDDDDTVFAYQLIAGASINVYQNIDIFVEYRYFATDDPEVSPTGGRETETEFETNNVLLGVRFTF